MSRVEFLNDWKRLEAAVAELAEYTAGHEKCDPDYCDLNTDFAGVDFKAIVELVPRLIKAHKDLWKYSDDLLTAWEAYMASQQPAGLYVPPTSRPRKA
jgi:hypothetical protein